MSIPDYFSDLRNNLLRSVPSLCSEVESQCDALFSSYRLGSAPGPTVVRCAISGDVRLTAVEHALVLSPLFGRLHRLRQISTVSLVYPNATHTKASTSLEALGVTQSYLDALALRADQVGAPRPSNEDVEALRLAALLNDIASGPYNYVLWPLVERQSTAIFEAARFTISRVLRIRDVPSAQDIATILLLLSPKFQRVLSNLTGSEQHSKTLTIRIIAALLGSSEFLLTKYLNGIMYGPLEPVRVARQYLDLASTSQLNSFDLPRLLASLNLYRVQPIEFAGHISSPTGSSP